MKISHILLTLGLASMLLGCASSYHSINPQGLYLPSTSSQEDLSFAYKYDVLRASGNKKYAKKEDKKGIRVVAIRITNNTGRTLHFPDDLELVSGDRTIYPLDPNLVYSNLKQGVPIYLLYMLFTPMNLTVTTDTETSVTPVGLFLGPGLTALNMGIAASANSKFKDELMIYNLNNLSIKDGDTIYGLVGVPDNGFAPLALELK